MPSPEQTEPELVSQDANEDTERKGYQQIADDFNADPGYFDRMAELRTAKAESVGDLSRTAFSSIDPTFRLDTIPLGDRVGPPQGSMQEDLSRQMRLDAEDRSYNANRAREAGDQLDKVA
jgi:hypothetical protein